MEMGKGVMESWARVEEELEGKVKEENEKQKSGGGLWGKESEERDQMTQAV